MDIALKKNKGAETVRISGKNQKVFIYYKNDYDVDKIEESKRISVIIDEVSKNDSKVSQAGGLIVSSNGEYEKDEVYISARVNFFETQKLNQSKDDQSQDTDQSLAEEKQGNDSLKASGQVQTSNKSKVLDVIEIEIDSIRVLFFASKKIINKDLLNDLGVIDVMIVSLDENLEAQVKSVSKVDPQIVIPLSDDQKLIEKFKNEVGGKSSETKKYKCKSTDFSSEDFVLEVIVLEK